MGAYSLTHLSDPALLDRLAVITARNRATTASLLAHLAEVDERKLYLPAGYASMFAYCVQELHFSEDAAAKRIQVARAARRFPALFAAVEDGRLHLTAARLIAPHLTAENFDELVAEATHRGRTTIERMIEQRLAAKTGPLGLDIGAAAATFPAATTALEPDLLSIPESSGDPGPEPPAEHAPGHGSGRAPVAPAAAAPPMRIVLKVAVSEVTHLKLRHAQALLSHAVPSADVAQVLDRALDALIAQLEKRKFAATPRPRAPRGSSTRPRHIPAQVKREVWKRDDGRCTFVGNTGHRCGERRFLEFDHVEPVARGGRASTEGIRLRCRAHNQYEAERLFGAGFMRRKRRVTAAQAPVDG